MPITALTMVASSGLLVIWFTNDLVDLQGIDRKLPQITQAGIAGAEVIDRKLYAQVCERMQHGIARLGIAHEHAFGQFEFQIARLQTRLREGRADYFRENPWRGTRARRC